MWENGLAKILYPWIFNSQGYSVICLEIDDVILLVDGVFTTFYPTIDIF